MPAVYFRRQINKIGSCFQIELSMQGALEAHLFMCGTHVAIQRVLAVLAIWLLGCGQLRMELPHALA